MNRSYISVFGILITIIVLNLQGCSESVPKMVVSSPPDYVIAGVDDQDFVQIFIPLSEEIEFDLKSQNDTFRHYSALFDLNDDQEINLKFNLFILEEDQRKVLLIKSLAGLQTPVRFDLEAIKDDNEFVDQVSSFPKTRAVEKGVKIKKEDFDWVKERDLFALTKIRNSAGSLTGIRPFGDRSYLPILFQNKIGYIEFELNFDNQEELPSLRYNKTVVLEDL